jgi:hypothetical protein
MTFENPTDNLVWPTSVPYGWSVEWESRPAVTLRSDTRPRAKRGVRLRDVCSRVNFSFRCEFGQAVTLVSLNTVCISYLYLNSACNNVCMAVKLKVDELFCDVNSPSYEVNLLRSC